MSTSGSLGAWRKEQSKILAEIVQKNLEILQNPTNCKDPSKKIVCNVNHGGCGFGCQLHHVIRCFTLAINLNRTLILLSAGWSYNPAGYEFYFKPVSNSCTTAKPYQSNFEIKGKFFKILLVF